MRPRAPATRAELVVTFPRRLARVGVLGFTALLAVFAGWVHAEPGGETPWLAVVAGTGCLFGVVLSLGQLLWPRVLAEAGAEGIVIWRRRLPGGRAEVPWPQVREISYAEKEVDRFLYKVVRLRLQGPVDDGFRLFKDEADTAHLDAFAADPGGEDLLAELLRIKKSSADRG